MGVYAHVRFEVRRAKKKHQAGQTFLEESRFSAFQKSMISISNFWLDYNKETKTFTLGQAKSFPALFVAEN